MTKANPTLMRPVCWPREADPSTKGPNQGYLMMSSVDPVFVTKSVWRTATWLCCSPLSSVGKGVTEVETDIEHCRV